MEALLDNLLHEKFNSPNDPHRVLERFCEHVHMGLTDRGDIKK